MKLLADENMDGDIVAWLRSAGCDVASVMESMRGADDDEILARANAEQRIILTKDMDFGEMIFGGKKNAAGVILLRLHLLGRAARLTILRKQWAEISKHAAGNFVVVMQDRLRIRAIAPQKP